MLRKIYTYLNTYMFLPLYNQSPFGTLYPGMFPIHSWGQIGTDAAESHKAGPRLFRLLHEERLFSLGIATSEEWRIRGGMIQTYQTLHAIDMVGEDNFLQLVGHAHPNTKGHSLKLENPRHRTT